MIDWKFWWRFLGEKTRGPHDDHDREQDPYMVTVQASRVTGNAPLFDSEHQHRGYIQLRISSAYRDRGLGRDWISTDKELIEVSMSEAQWAAMISSMNYGSGVPATLSHIMQNRVEQPPAPENRTALYHGEFMDRLQSAIDRIDAMAKGKLTKAQKQELDMIRQEIESNAPFMAKQFDEHMETRVEKAKSDIEAHMNASVQRVGLAAMKQSERLAELLEGTEQAQNVKLENPS